jgi:multicomponent Na+:H+ antiporter subunit D
MFIAILVPLLSGFLVPVIRFGSRRSRNILIEATVIITSVIVCLLLVFSPEGNFVFAVFTKSLSLSLSIDGMSRVFAGLISFMWPLASLYAFEYMTKEENEPIFFMFYTMTYGITLGIAFSEDIFTMYFFYELLTLVTVPLILHTLTREAVLACRSYLYYSMGGAAFAFIGLAFIISYSADIDFRYGGVLSKARITGNENVLLLIYVLAFMGFGVKAAIFPVGGWLPKASVAPTPVTALLHAVAVVNAGAFANIRLTYYCFGTEFLKGTWARTVVMCVAIMTILYSSTRAVKETHIKRRLAWSTSSNLSYILFGVTIMTPLGLLGALSHFVIHAFMKICSFFCAGAIIHQTTQDNPRGGGFSPGVAFVHELDGLGAKMPGVFFIFTVSAMSLMGVPGLAGFISKWNLATAAVDAGGAGCYAGIAALLISALLTAIYMASMIMRAYFPGKDNGQDSGASSKGGVRECKDPNWMMMLPLGIFAFVIVILGLFSGPLVSFLRTVAEGRI